MFAKSFLILDADTIVWFVKKSLTLCIWLSLMMRPARWENQPTFIIQHDS